MISAKRHMYHRERERVRLTKYTAHTRTTYKEYTKRKGQKKSWHHFENMKELAASIADAKIIQQLNPLLRGTLQN
jgi:hypothetical protein